MTQPFEIDMHSEFLRADLFLAMGQPTEAARILERVVEAEPTNEAALELLARAYFGSAQLGTLRGDADPARRAGADQRLGPARAGPHAGAAEPGRRGRRPPPDGGRPRRRVSQSSAAMPPISSRECSGSSAMSLSRSKACV